MLKELMKEKDISTSQLSEITGISKRTLEGYISRRRKISFENGLKIADALGVDPKLLIKEPEWWLFYL